MKINLRKLVWLVQVSFVKRWKLGFFDSSYIGWMLND